MKIILTLIVFIALITVITQYKLKKAPWYNEEYGFFYYRKDIYTDDLGNECVTKIINNKKITIIHCKKSECP